MMSPPARIRRIAVAIAGASLVMALAAPATAAPGADLSVTKTDSPDLTVVGGANLTYTLTVANAGDDPAADVTLSDTISANTTFVSLTAAAGWTCTTPAVGGTGTVSCSKAPVAMGEGAVFTLVVNVTAGTADGTVITNTATVSSTGTPDPDPADNSATATTEVGLPLESCTITGTNMSDTIVGTPGDDVICAGNGKDTVDGAGGNDVIVGGNGKDVLDGGEGNDIIQGRNGKDTITGDLGLDVLVGGNGRDTLDAMDGAGGDVLDGGRGRDECLVDTGDTSTSCE